jgi:carbon storage regulator CsrA
VETVWHVRTPSGFFMEFKEMLVLTRKRFQTLSIGNDIKLTITKIKGGQVRLAIEAPKEVKILRSELKVKNGKAVK